METAIATLPEAMPMLEPAPLSKLLDAQERANELTVKLLKQGTDFAVIPGTQKPTLLKPGAEKILWAYNCFPEYQILAQEVDHDREVTYYDRSGRQLTSYGLYRFVVLCRIIHRPSGKCVGTGIGSASTLESRYISRPRDLENTVLKMAQKRALVAATLNAFALSDRFTQDVEDADVSDGGAPIRLATEQQIRKIHAIANALYKQNALTKEGYRQLLTEFGVASSKDLTEEQAEQFIQRLEALKAQPAATEPAEVETEQKAQVHDVGEALKARLT